jgi:hypothetical protein
MKKFNLRPCFRRALLAGVVASGVFLAFPCPVHAQDGSGGRVGISVNPDQVYFGGHLAVGPLVPRLWFRPNLEVGLGDGATVIALNGEFTYWVPMDRSPWSVYFGGGPALNLISARRRPFDADRTTDAEGGLNVLLGLGHRNGFFGELKVGALDSPEIKLGVGFSFR